MARSNPRLALGVGVISAFLLVGGPSVTIAVADPGHSGRGDRDDSDGNWGGSKRGGDGGSDRRGGGGDNRRSDNGFGDDDDGRRVGGGDAPQSRVGSGRTEIQQLSPGDSSSVNGSGSSDRSGSDHPGTPKTDFDPPRVTVGNGRSPGVQDDDREPRFGGNAPEPAPAPPPPPPPPPPRAAEPSWANRISTPPAMPKHLAVTPTAGWVEPLWGMAGLLLIPAAGAMLGYRQAKAAKSVSELGRT